MIASEVHDPESAITMKDQKKTEQDVTGFFQRFLAESYPGDEGMLLDRDLHTPWLQEALLQLPAYFSGLDASRPWFVYWISHALELLGAYPTEHYAPKVASFLAACRDPGGGYGGGPMQLAHLAPTYAVVAATLVAGEEVAYRAIDRAQVYRFLMRMKTPEGGFRMHDEGETDTRGTYCAMAVASMLHIVTDELIAGVAVHVRSLQTWEGGIAGEDGLEAHGGYAYCGLAALCIIGQASALDLGALLNWAVHRQMQVEGGFQGRTNKLVDSCYSFWQGALFALLHEAMRQEGRPNLPGTHLWFSPNPLQVYVLLACQGQGGGLRDKPGKAPDFYHTCYSLSGVSAAQHGLCAGQAVGEGTGNLLHRTDVFYNVNFEKAVRKCAYFDSLPPFEVDERMFEAHEGIGVVRAREHLFACATVVTAMNNGGEAATVPSSSAEVPTATVLADVD
eukprot:NODE_5336_length_1781_cov_12.019952.p1 GENE.NODE_5336_length_1781_cov_12.019952~~NODE_5336_length_1781_cov_12.019952.p1  ORF type:complete len:449 (+),score=104.52 NODE_5336_length_1781_cov_12.019952:191-1537(+)